MKIKNNMLYMKKQSKLNQNFQKIYDNARKKLTKKQKNNIIMITCGCFVGLINGLLGGGGGLICVPLLEKFLHFEKKKAHATSISIIFPLSLISAFVYVFSGNIPSLPLVFVTLGVVCGGVSGALLLKVLPEKVVSIVFACIMIVAGLRLVL